MTAVMFPHGGVQQIGNETGAHVREFARLVFSHIQLIFFLLLLIFLTTVAAGIGLLRRKNSARIVFIGLMILGVVWNITSIILMYYFLPSMSDVLMMPSPVLQWPFDILRNILFVFGLIMSLGCVGLFGWIAARLVSEEIQQEFL